eukprot:10067244-Alexandrium_andersonii.AAC.1
MLSSCSSWPRPESPGQQRARRSATGPRVRALLFGVVNGATPQRRSPAWAAARDEITALAGLRRVPRSWQELDRVLHGRAAPA